ncbi:MAG: acetyl-CoA carboxylase biotin carboxyl carrier protein [Pseudomonadota bacterium]
MANSVDEDLRVVRELAKVLAKTDLSEVEFERDGLKLRVARTVTQVAAAPPAVAVAAAPPATIAAAGAAPQAVASETPASQEPAPPPAGEQIKSPMVGTAYLSPSPGAEPFISVGDAVSAGQTLMIVEAMKTMNAIKAPRAGKVVDIMARNAEPVEFDELLLILGD